MLIPRRRILSVKSPSHSFEDTPSYTEVPSLTVSAKCLHVLPEHVCDLLLFSHLWLDEIDQARHCSLSISCQCHQDLDRTSPNLKSQLTASSSPKSIGWGARLIGGIGLSGWNDSPDATSPTRTTNSLRPHAPTIGKIFKQTFMGGGSSSGNHASRNSPTGSNELQQKARKIKRYGTAPEGEVPEAMVDYATTIMASSHAKQQQQQAAGSGRAPLVRHSSFSSDPVQPQVGNGHKGENFHICLKFTISR